MTVIQNLVKIKLLWVIGKIEKYNDFFVLTLTTPCSFYILTISGLRSTISTGRDSTEILSQWDSENSMPGGNKPRRHVFDPPNKY